MRVGRFIRSEAEAVKAGPINICGVLVHAHPDKFDAVRQFLLELPGVEIHQQSPDGRLVVTVEDTPDSWAGETIKYIQETPGVLVASLVYHHFDESQVSGESFS